MSEMKKTNVDRLLEAGVLTDQYLNDDAKAVINAIKLNDEEIKILKEFKDKLGLTPLELKPGQGLHVMGSL